MPRKSTAEQIRAVLESYAETFDIDRACRKAKVHRATHYRWLRKTRPLVDHPRGYAAAFQRIRDDAGDYLESVAIERATTGWKEPVFYQGGVCGHVQRFSDALLMQLLRGFKPEKYAVQRQEVSGLAGAPVQARIEVVFVRPGDNPRSPEQQSPVS